MSDDELLPEQVNLRWLARHVLALRRDVQSVRDDLLVISAVLTRLDSNQTLVFGEMRAMRSQHDRLRSRVQTLEEEDER